METNTVTIELEKYEEMKAEINRLRKENEEKTILKSYPHPAFIIAMCLIACAAWIGLTMNLL